MATETYKIVGGKATIEKDPDATLDYGFNWGPWLTPINDVIATVEFDIDPTLTQESVENTTTTATIYVSGGTPGTTVPITCRITTTNAPTERIDDRTIYLKIKDR